MFNKKIFKWGLYDFANSILIGNLTLYFVQYVVIDRGLPDIIFSTALTIGSILLLFLAPGVGIFIDNGTKKIRLIRIFSVLILAGGIGLGLIQNAILLLTLFLIIRVAYQASLVPYNTVIIDIAEPNRRGFASGFGEFCNWAGYLIGLVITLPIINGSFSLFGTGRQGVFIPATLLFLFLGLPFLISHKEKQKERKKVKILKSYKDLIFFLKSKDRRGAVMFLLIYFLANNAAATFVAFGPLYFEVVEKIPDQSKVLLTALTLIFAAIGAIIGGKLNDKYGSYRVLSKVIIIWTIALTLVVLGSGFWYLVPFTIVVGLLMGAFGSIGRKFLTDLIPEEDAGRFFGIYSLSIKLSAFIGLPLWSLTALLFASTGDNRYKFSMLSLSILLLASFIVLKKFKKVLDVRTSLSAKTLGSDTDKQCPRT
jgi:MFS transporter, UMF1 family